MKRFKLISGEWLSVCMLLNAEQNKAAKGRGGHRGPAELRWSAIGQSRFSQHKNSPIMAHSLSRPESQYMQE